MRGRTAREVERMVAGLAPGDGPGDIPAEVHRKHVLRLELTSEQMATYREAIMKLQRDAGGGLEENEAVLLMARQVLGGPSDDGRSSYQVCVSRCPSCERAWQQGNGEQIELDEAARDAVACDAQHIGSAHVGQPARATQTIPPAVRRQVVARDHHQCVMPGCRHAAFVDVHHVVPRSEGGTHDPDLLITLCSAHHAANHRGRLRIEGTVSTGLRITHADGSTYGELTSPQIALAFADAFAGLRQLGFKEGPARQALAAVRPANDDSATDAGEVIKAALRILTRGA